MFANPLLARLQDSETVLLCGCGGGFDFMSAIPLWEYLRGLGKTCVLGSLCFTDCNRLRRDTTPNFNGNRHLFELSRLSEPSSRSFTGYMPEVHFCRFVHDNRDDLSDLKIYAFFSSPATMAFSYNDIDVAQLQACYEDLIDHYNVDAIVVCDGGTDSLMRGDEHRVGTVAEDMTSIAAVHRARGVAQEKKILLSLGWGIDAYHGCEAYHCLENISHLIKTTEGGFLGCWSLVKQSEEYQHWKEAFEYVMEQMSFTSIVGSSIIAATEGEFGNFHSTKRTANSELFINPLMSIYWCFDLNEIAKQIYFIQDAINGDSDDVMEGFAEWRQQMEAEGKIRPVKKYPH